MSIFFLSFATIIIISCPWLFFVFLNSIILIAFLVFFRIWSSSFETFLWLCWIVHVYLWIKRTFIQNILCVSWSKNFRWSKDSKQIIIVFFSFFPFFRLIYWTYNTTPGADHSCFNYLIVLSEKLTRSNNKNRTWTALVRIAMTWNGNMMLVLIHGSQRSFFGGKQMMPFVHHYLKFTSTVLRWGECH